MFQAVVLPDPEGGGRWCTCRYHPAVGATAEVSYLNRATAERARSKLQAVFDEATQAPTPSIDPWEPRQLALGFYTDEDAK